MNGVAGDSEEVDKSIEMAKSAAVEGLVRSGAAGSLLSNVPGGGALLGMFGGLGGKKKRVAAGIKLLNPANGQAIVVGSGDDDRRLSAVHPGEPDGGLRAVDRKSTRLNSSH